MEPNNNFLKSKSIVMLGGPGSGKGTQTPLLSEYMNTPSIVAGDLLRKMSKSEKWISDIIDKGGMLSDEQINTIMSKNISRDTNYIFDGYPRSIKQAQFLDQQKKINSAVWIDVKDDLLVERLIKRGLTSNRKDDSDIDIIKSRLDLYHSKIIPILDYYKLSGRLIRVNGDQDIETVFNQIKKILNI